MHDDYPRTTQRQLPLTTTTMNNEASASRRIDEMTRHDKLEPQDTSFGMFFFGFCRLFTLLTTILGATSMCTQRVEGTRSSQRVPTSRRVRNESTSTWGVNSTSLANARCFFLCYYILNNILLVGTCSTRLTGPNQFRLVVVATVNANRYSKIAWTWKPTAVVPVPWGNVEVSVD